MPKTSTIPPTILVIFGASGDLIEKKIAPALWHLLDDGHTPRKFKVIGFSRRQWTDTEFRNHLATILKKHKDTRHGKKTKAFLKHFEYSHGTFEQYASYTKLLKRLQAIDDSWQVCSNKLFYLAVPPRNYKIIFNHLAKSELTKPCGGDDGWTRVVVEKPFGKDAKTARALDAQLGKLFKEEQIYRIDHYLGKEMMQNILAFRFTNNLFEKSWHKGLIEKINIRVFEKVGVKGRGKFYDGVGALRDVGQNHLLQMLALVTMDNPRALESETIRRQRAAILNKLARPTQATVKKQSFRGQYKGYRRERGVEKKSTTETYFKVQATLDDPKWQNVPIFLESGKKLKEGRKEIEITFRHPNPCVCPPGGHHYKNRIFFVLDPQPEIIMHFWVKTPGLAMHLEKRVFEFASPVRTSAQYVEEYEKLLYDSIRGDQTLFVSTDEITSMWRFTDVFLRVWQAHDVPLVAYDQSSMTIVRKAAALEADKKSSLSKELGIVGLGKMGAGIAQNLLDNGWRVVGYNRSPRPANQLVGVGLEAAYSLAEMIKKLKPPRIIWLMVPAGKPVDQTLFGKGGLVSLLDKGDYIVDGGNSFFENTVKRYPKVLKHGIRFVDAGVSGGPGGARNGACIMIGGASHDFLHLEELFDDLTVDQGYEFFAGNGAGHYVKMVHNGIEYGMMQSIAEGIDILKRSKYKPDLTRVASIYNHGSVIESRLIGWLHKAFKEKGENLRGITGSAAESGEGAWTVRSAKKKGINVDVIADSLKARRRSQKKPSYQGQIISALRNQFGGHEARKGK